MGPGENRDPGEEFERRVLALIRDQIAGWKEEYPKGFEIGDFVLSSQIYTPPDEPIEPWHGGPFPGWWKGVAMRGSATSWGTDREILEASLRVVEEGLYESRQAWWESRMDEILDEEEDEDEA